MTLDVRSDRGPVFLIPPFDFLTRRVCGAAVAVVAPPEAPLAVAPPIAVSTVSTTEPTAPPTASCGGETGGGGAGWGCGSGSGGTGGTGTGRGGAGGTGTGRGGTWARAAGAVTQKRAATARGRAMRPVNAEWMVPV